MAASNGQVARSWLDINGALTRRPHNWERTTQANNPSHPTKQRPPVHASEATGPPKNNACSHHPKRYGTVRLNASEGLDGMAKNRARSNNGKRQHSKSRTYVSHWTWVACCLASLPRAPASDSANPALCPNFGRTVQRRPPSLVWQDLVSLQSATEQKTASSAPGPFDGSEKASSMGFSSIARVATQGL